MGFPVLLVSLFFLTLNFNPSVLYAPSDFQDEANFMHVLTGTKRLSSDVDVLATQLQATRDDIVQRLAKELGSKEAERQDLSKTVAQQMETLRAQLESVRRSADQLASDAAAEAFPHSALQAQVLSFLADQERFVPVEEIVRVCGKGTDATRRALGRLEKRGLIKPLNEEGTEFAAVD
jgi:hypothetical protein